MKNKVYLAFFMVILISTELLAYQGTWDQNGMAICVEGERQVEPCIVQDGVGGAIVAWEDERGGLWCNDVYAQRISPSGSMLWPTTGVAICNANRYQGSVKIASDDANGVIVTWVDDRYNNGMDIFAQRVDFNGNILWTSNGIAICLANDYQTNPQIIPDGENGAIITWYDGRNGNGDIYIQRISALGNILWAANGVVVCDDDSSQEEYHLVSDNSGGAIIVWVDYKNGDSDIYAQRVDAQGNTLWANNGIVICDEVQGQYRAQLIADGMGGAIIVWKDLRDIANGNAAVYAQRINGAGAVLWDENGVLIASSNGYNEDLQLVSDGSNGAIITWWDNRNTDQFQSDIYAQRINSAGSVLWPMNSVLVCDAFYMQRNPRLASDGMGGAFITWHDERSGLSIYAHRIDSSGNLLWPSNGIVICDAPNNQVNGRIVSDDSGGAIVVWEDNRDPGYDIYAQHIIRLRPMVQSVAPSQAAKNNIVEITVNGENFSDDKGSVSCVKLTMDGKPDIVGYALDCTSDTVLKNKIDLTEACPGEWKVTVIDSIGQTANGNFLFTVNELMPIRTVTATHSPTTTPIVSGQINTHGKAVFAYPNPGHGKINFIIERDGIEKIVVTIYNLAGEKICQIEEDTPNQVVAWDTDQTAPGIYIYKVIVIKDGHKKCLAIDKICILK